MPLFSEIRRIQNFILKRAIDVVERFPKSRFKAYDRFHDEHKQWKINKKSTLYGLQDASVSTSPISSINSESSANGNYRKALAKRLNEFLEGKGYQPSHNLDLPSFLSLIHAKWMYMFVHLSNIEESIQRTQEHGVSTTALTGHLDDFKKALSETESLLNNEANKEHPLLVSSDSVGLPFQEPDDIAETLKFNWLLTQFLLHFNYQYSPDEENKAQTTLIRYQQRLLESIKNKQALPEETTERSVSETILANFPHLVFLHSLSRDEFYFIISLVFDSQPKAASVVENNIFENSEELSLLYKNRFEKILSFVREKRKRKIQSESVKRLSSEAPLESDSESSAFEIEEEVMKEFLQRNSSR